MDLQIWSTIWAFWATGLGRGLALTWPLDLGGQKCLAWRLLKKLETACAEPEGRSNMYDKNPAQSRCLLFYALACLPRYLGRHLPTNLGSMRRLIQGTSQRGLIQV